MTYVEAHSHRYTVTPDQLNARHRIALAQHAHAVALTNLRKAVEEARADGLSWTMVAEGLGCSRQAAAERFSKPL